MLKEAGSWSWLHSSMRLTSMTQISCPQPIITISTAQFLWSVVSSNTSHTRSLCTLAAKALCWAWNTRGNHTLRIVVSCADNRTPFHLKKGPPAQKGPITAVLAEKSFEEAQSVQWYPGLGQQLRDIHVEPLPDQARSWRCRKQHGLYLAPLLSIAPVLPRCQVALD